MSDRGRRPHGRKEAAAAPEAPREASASADEAELERLRTEILQCDRDLVGVISRRRELVREIGRIKRELGLPVTDPAREAAVVRRAAERARAAGIDEKLVRDVLWAVMASARGDQRAEADARGETCKRAGGGPAQAG